jgi:hypothetical protein
MKGLLEPWVERLRYWMLYESGPLVSVPSSLPASLLCATLQAAQVDRFQGHGPGPFLV